MAFARRLSIEQLRHAGIDIFHSNFVVARRPLVYGFATHPVGAPPPVMPRHRIVQLYRMRRLDAIQTNQMNANPVPTRPQFKRNPGDEAPTRVPLVIPMAVAGPNPGVSADSFDFVLPDVETPVEAAPDPATPPAYRNRSNRNRNRQHNR